MANTNGYMFLKFSHDSQLLLFWNRFWDVQDELVHIETWYFKIAFNNTFLLMKHVTFLKSKLNFLRTNPKLYFKL